MAKGLYYYFSDKYKMKDSLISCSYAPKTSIGPLGVEMSKCSNETGNNDSSTW